MGIWDLIFGRTNHKIIKDDFFGELMIQDNFGTFKRHFAPLNQAINGSLELDNGKPNAEQKAFYPLIEQAYQGLIPAFITAIEKEFANWDNNFKVYDFNKEFTLVGVSLSLCKSEPIGWELSFDTIHDDKHTLFITMADFEIEQVMIDG
jgi:hypothetical protein